MSDWPKIKRTREYQDGHREMVKEVERLIEEKTKPLLKRLADMESHAGELEADIEALKAKR